MGESEGSRRVAPVFVRRIDDAYLMVVKCISLLGSEFCCSACSAITSSLWSRPMVAVPILNLINYPIGALLLRLAIRGSSSLQGSESNPRD